MFEYSLIPCDRLRKLNPGQLLPIGSMQVHGPGRLRCGMNGRFQKPVSTLFWCLQTFKLLDLLLELDFVALST